MNHGPESLLDFWAIIEKKKKGMVKGMNRLEASLTGKENNYVAPFFWQHGESEEILREYMKVIYEANIHAVCVESRPHPDFVGDKWWQDMDVIMDEARNRQMKVWILDDSHFPTGYANGAVLNAPKELKHQYLVYQMLEMCGPSVELELTVTDYLLSEYTNQPDPEAQLVKILACPIEAGEKLGEPMDLTEKISGAQLVFGLPDGYFRIFIIYLTREAKGRNDYINFMDPESCKLLIDTVYEPHYARYGADFGATISGFFSDEPPIGNVEGYMPVGPIGTAKQNLPWSALAADRFTQEFGSDQWLLYLPYLWAEAANSKIQAKERNAYMQMVTKLVAECFSVQIGTWCESHGVEYIGHMLEDCDINSDLGISMGHFFRGLSGQHMAGIDNIGGQVMINGEDVPRHPGSPCKDEAGFYHYLMGKLGTSHGAIDPKKKGRCMCENFGAYGWQMGTKEEKFMMDHFMVRGVNRYVPHAFSPAPFPDPDCPPHFYAHGENPLYRAFGQLMAYTNRVCHMIDGGKSIPDVAVLYNGESKWAGNGDSNIPVARALATAQVDFHVIPADVFAEESLYPSDLIGGKLLVNDNAYQALIISGCDYVTAEVAAFVQQAVTMQYPIVFADGRPIGISGAAEEINVEFQKFVQDCPVVKASEMGKYCKEQFVPETMCSPKAKKLVTYHYKTELDSFLILNEEAEQTYYGSLLFRSENPQAVKRVLRWYPWENKLEEVPFETGNENYIQVNVAIDPLELTMFVLDIEGTMLIGNKTVQKQTNQQIPLTQFEVNQMTSKDYLAKCGLRTETDKTENAEAIAAEKMESSVGMVQAPFTGMQEQFPEYSGYYIYHTHVLLQAETSYAVFIEDAYESVEVFLDGTSCGMKLQKPFRFQLPQFAADGEHVLAIEVATTLERKVKAMGANISCMSMPRPLSPTGIVGKVLLEKMGK